MKRIIIIISSLFFLSSTTDVFSQMVVQENLTPEEMANSITGSGVTIMNPQVFGAPGSYGGFTASGIVNFPLQQGLILTTGKIIDAIGPNLSQNTTTVHDNSLTSATLQIIADTLPIKDACTLEFDIIPDGDTLKFNFAFASEEYDEFVCTPYDDIFGFFISGPGIVGDPGLGGKKNIALVPGTSTPVTINTVNSGNPTASDPCPGVNSAYHVSNPLSAISAIQYDGWTNGIIAIAGGLIPCETYHLEIVIADVNDRSYDSGVFIEKIESNNVQVEINTIGNTETMIEGCNNGIIEFCANEPVTSDLTLNYLLQGTAVNGVDYDLIGDPDPMVTKQVVITVGNTCAVVNINTIDDGMAEVDEYVDVILLNPICDGLITDSVHAIILDELEIEIVGDNTICEGESVLLEAVGDANTYQWGPSSAEFNGLENVFNPIVTLYETTTVTVETTVAGCVATDDFTIDVSHFNLDFTFTPDGCSPGTCDGEISLVVTGGVEPYTYDWGNGDTTSTISGVCAGEYTISIHDADGCTKRDTVDLAMGTEMTVLLSTSQFNGGYGVSCNGGFNGTVTAIASGGIGGYTYQWNDPNNSTTASISGLGAGTYTVTVTDDMGCVVIESIEITEPPLLELTLVSQADVFCGGNTGAIEVIANGGTPNYTYTWTLGIDVVGTGAILSSVGVGDYTVTVVDQNGCTQTMEISVNGPQNPLEGTSTQTDVTCFGDNNGSVTVSGQGGTLGAGNDYQYLWLDNNSTNPFRDNLSPGLYQVEITDDSGCTILYSVNILGPNAALSINIISQEDIACSGVSCAFVEVVGQGGSSGYTYEWNEVPAIPVPFSVSSAVDICTPGDYQVEVTDANGCTFTEFITITLTSLPMSINATITDANCDGDNSGAIDVTVNGGVPGYTYVWTSDCGLGPFTTEDISNICAGQWTLTVTDNSGCIKEFNLTVSEESDISLSFVMTPTLCVDDSSGALDITPQGGVGNYTYAWFGPAATIGGAFDITDTIATTQDIMGSPKGEYLVAITDDNGCTYLQEMLITAPAAITISLDNISDYNGFGVSCNGSCNGIINTTVSGGTVDPLGDYSFLWQDQAQGFSLNTNGIGGEDVTGFCASQDANGYELIVVDDNNCIQNAFFIITEPDPINISFNSESNPSCNGATDGSITAQVSGGVPGYSYEWRPGNDMNLPVISTAPILDGVAAGTYCVTITDANDCTQTACFTLDDPQTLTVNLSFVPQTNGFAVSCFGENDAVILSTVNGGDGNYTYAWSDCSAPPFAEGNVPSVSGLSVGTYCVTVTDGSGCTGQGTITLTSPTAIMDNAVVDDASCSGGNTGSITLNLSGGSGTYPIIDWTPDGLIPDGTVGGSGLPQGIYNVYIEDSFGCSANYEYEIGGSAAIIVTLTSPVLANGFNVSCNGVCDASINASIVGGTGNPTITWTGPAPVGGTAGNPTSFNGVVCAGEYTITVTDGVCVGSDMITITEPEPIVINIQELQSISCDNDCNGQLSASASGGGGGYTYQWDGGQPTGAITEANLCEGQHCVTVTDISGCTNTQCYTIVAPAPMVITPTITPVSCNGLCDGSISVAVMGGASGYDYDWSGPGDFTANTSAINDLCGGVYTVIVTDDNGCMEEVSYTVNEPGALDLEINVSDYNGTGVSCASDCDGWISANYLGGGVGTITWQGPGSPAPADSIFNLCEGTYILTLNNGGVCERVDTIVISAPESIIVDLSSELFPGGTNLSCFGDASGSITSDVVGGFGDFEYYWIQGADTIVVGGSEIDGLEAGTYTLIVEDENGCTGQSDITLTQPDLPFTVEMNAFVFPNGANTSCGNICDGSITTVVSNGLGEIDYFWVGPGLNEEDSLSSVSDLCAGIYVVSVTDENNCTATAVDTLTPGVELEILADIDNLECFGANDANIDITVVGSDSEITYSWTGDIVSSDEDLMNISSGTYNVMVLDANGCSATEEYTISSPDTIIVSLFPSFPVEAPGFNISGPGAADGFIQSSVEGGVEPYSYQWITPDITDNFGNVSSITGLSGGQHCLNVTDNNGCIASLCVDMLEPLELHLPNGVSPNGDGINDGLIIEGLELYPKNVVKIFNRWGNIVFERKDYSNTDTWKGEGLNGNFVADGTYFVVVSLDNSEKELHGYLEVRR